MARQHGKDCMVLLGGYNRSGDIISITPKTTAQTHDGTALGDDWAVTHAGVLGWEADIAAFYDGAAAAIGRQFEDLLGVDGVLTIVDGDGDAVGDTAQCYGNGILTSRDQPITVGDMVKLNGNIRGNGKAGLKGVLLHELSEETGTGSTSGDDIHNNSASSASGGRGNLHITAITGTWTITIDHSNDAAGVDPWTAAITFTAHAAAGGVTAETKEAAGTIKQFTRVTYTEDVAGSCTFLVCLARY